MIRHVAEGERNGDLEKEADGSQCVAREGGETKTVDDGRGVGVKGTLRTVVAQRDQEMDIETPIGELPRGKARPREVSESAIDINNSRVVINTNGFDRDDNGDLPPS